MKFQELSRTATPGEVRSSYAVAGNLTVHLTSRFNGKVSLEDAMYQIVLQQLRSQKEPEGRQSRDGLVDEKVV